MNKKGSSPIALTVQQQTLGLGHQAVRSGPASPRVVKGLAGKGLFAFSIRTLILLLVLTRALPTLQSGKSGRLEALLSCVESPGTLHIRGTLMDVPQQRSRSTVSLLLSAEKIRIGDEQQWRQAGGELIELSVYTRKSKTQTGRITDQLPQLIAATACGSRIEAQTRYRAASTHPRQRVQHLGRTWRFRRPSAGRVRAYWKNVRVLEPPPAHTVGYRLRAFKSTLLLTYQNLFSDPVYRLAAGATLGDRGPVKSGTYRSRRISRLFDHAGLGHVLAVSGLHVGTLAGACLWLMTRLHLPLRRQVVPLTAVLGIFFCLTGGRPATARAVLMTLVSLYTYARHRTGLKRSVWRGITTAAILLLLYEPRLLFDMGSQLSFAAVASLIGLTRPIQSRLDRWLSPIGWARLPRSCRSLIAAQIAIQLGMVLPFSSLYFGRYSVAGIFVNLLAIPLIGIFVPITLLAGMLYLIPLIGPALAWLPTCGVELTGHAFFAIAHFGAELFPYPSIPKIPGWLLIPYYLTLIALLHPRCKRSRRNRPSSPGTKTQKNVGGPPRGAIRLPKET